MRSRVLAGLTLAPLVLGGCGATTPSSGDGRTVEVSIQGESVSPSAESLDLAVGATLTLHVVSDRAGEIHVHSTPEQEFAITRGDSTFTVELAQPGQVDVEEHESGQLLARVVVR